MNRIIIGILLNIILALPLFGQQPYQDRAKKIEALKAAYITKKIDLTPEESQKFWPVYNEYQREITSLHRQKRELKRNNAPDALNRDLDLDEKMLDIKKKYQKEFSKILPPQKILALYQAEREFREELIKELRERRELKGRRK